MGDTETAAPTLMELHKLSTGYEPDAVVGYPIPCSKFVRYLANTVQNATFVGQHLSLFMIQSNRTARNNLCKEDEEMLYGITNVAVEDYLAGLVPPRPPVLSELEQRAEPEGLSLIGPVQGQFLYMLARSIRAREALEVGMTTGYAAMWILQALIEEDGHLTAVESQEARYSLANELMQKAGYRDRFTIHTSEWADTLPTLNATYDLIFLDVLRSLTSSDLALKALDLCVPLLRPGGLLIGDNVLCSAQVLEQTASPTVQGIQLFNQKVMSHTQLESVIVPIRDGVSISRKKT